MTALALYFGIAIFMNGSDFAAIHGSYAQKLGLPGSNLIPYIPWLALAGYGLAVFRLRFLKRSKTRWIGFILVTFAANGITAYPILLLNHGSVSIPIADFVSKENHFVFETAYPVKWVSYSSSAEGTCIRVRNEDYSEQMASFVQELVKKQAGAGTK